MQMTHLQPQNTSFVRLTVPEGSTWVRKKAFMFSEISSQKSLQEVSQLVSLAEFKDSAAAADQSYNSCCCSE